MIARSLLLLALPLRLLALSLPLRPLTLITPTHTHSPNCTVSLECDRIQGLAPRAIDPRRHHAAPARDRCDRAALSRRDVLLGLVAYAHARLLRSPADDRSLDPRGHGDLRLPRHRRAFLLHPGRLGRDIRRRADIARAGRRWRGEACGPDALLHAARCRRTDPRDARRAHAVRCVVGALRGGAHAECFRGERPASARAVVARRRPRDRAGDGVEVYLDPHPRLDRARLHSPS